MYTSTNLIIYKEKESDISNHLNETILNKNMPFRESHSVSLTFSFMKNPENIVIIIVKTKDFLNQIESIALECFNYQKRLFIIHHSNTLQDFFFENTCTLDDLTSLQHFLDNIKTSTPSKPSHTSQLLSKILTLELEKLDISNKYVGFNYLVDALSNAFEKDFYSTSHIDLFTKVASKNLMNVDTIERDVRHMLLKTWNNSSIFKKALMSSPHKLTKINAKNILNSLLLYLKDIV